MRTRTIKGVLNNFLGTYTSRYSDFDVYWLFGFLREDVRIDLTFNSDRTERDDCTPFHLVKQLAVAKFLEQIEKASFNRLSLDQAHLDITRSEHPIHGFVNGHSCSGYVMKFEATATTESGKIYKSEMSLFVSPHNPCVERRSARIH